MEMREMRLSKEIHCLSSKLCSDRRTLFKFASSTLLLSILPLPFSNNAYASSPVTLIAILNRILGVFQIKPWSSARASVMNNVVEQSAELLVVQQRLIDISKDLRLKVRDEVGRSFHEKKMREILSEIDDYKIMVASGLNSYSNDTLELKAERLSRLSLSIAEYGPVALPTFSIINHIIYRINISIKKSPVQQADFYQLHSAQMYNWLKNNSNDLIGKYLALRKVVSNINLSTSKSINIIEIGRAASNTDNVIQIATLKIRFRFISGKVLVSPIVNEAAEIYFKSNIPMYIQSEFGDIALDKVKMNFDSIPELYRSEVEALHELTNESFTIENDKEGDSKITNWLEDEVCLKIQNKVNGYLKYRKYYEDTYLETKLFVETIERSASILQSYSAMLTNSPVNKRGSFIRPLAEI